MLYLFKVKHVSYKEDFYDGKKVSASRLITSIDHSIVHAEYVEIYAINHDTDPHGIAYELGWYDYHMMIIMDYLIGNSDRHWANWGFLVDNETNKLLGLYPQMDFNKAFKAYNSMNGGLCLPSGGMMSQQYAAQASVRAVGLNQISEVKEEWFDEPDKWEMFQKRLSYLKLV